MGQVRLIVYLVLVLASVACNVTSVQDSPTSMPTKRNIAKTSPPPTDTLPQRFDLYPSSYIGCDELGRRDALFIRQISTDPTTLRYSDLRVIQDSMLFMYCEGTATFLGQVPHQRCIIAELFQRNIPNTLVQRRREDPSRLYEHYISIPGGLIAIRSYYC